ncbi:MAG: type II toxin-antitoxin system VapC family toxin [Pseudonocardiales bacterium]|nr:type II toxin-antitoxin system VapC family toxin [Pseudonocardiales bacterium]
MFLPDVNVLVYAFRRDATNHEHYRAWLDSTVNGDSSYGVSDLVLSGFVRVVTHPRVFREPSSLPEALAFARAVRDQPACQPVSPGQQHWSIFVRLCQQAGAKGNLVPDAFLAALAIESGCEWVTADRDYARFPGLRWRHPLDG